jgi:hypothetical protein
VHAPLDRLFEVFLLCCVLDQGAAWGKLWTFLLLLVYLSAVPTITWKCLAEWRTTPVTILVVLTTARAFCNRRGQPCPLPMIPPAIAL